MEKDEDLKILNRPALTKAKKNKTDLYICDQKRDVVTLKNSGLNVIGVPRGEPESYKEIFSGVSFKRIPKIIIALSNSQRSLESKIKLLTMFPNAKVLVPPEHFPRNIDLSRIKESAERQGKSFKNFLRKYTKDSFLQDRAETLNSYLIETRKGVDFIKTGFEELDRRIQGLNPRGLNTIFGSSSVGKTTFCKQLSDQVHEKYPDLPVFLFSSEDGPRVLDTMTLARLSYKMYSEKKVKLPMENLRLFIGGKSFKTKKYDKFLKRLLHEAEKLYGKHYYQISGQMKMDVHTIRSIVECQLDLIKKDTALVVTDYLQVLGDPKGMKNKSLLDRIDYNVTFLQKMADEMNISVVLTSSITKDAMERAKEKKPGITKVRGSANIVYSSRISIEILEEDHDEKENLRHLNFYIHKNSQGPKDISIPFKYHYKYSLFEEDDS
jgi:replicative DNA helicase